MSVERKIKELLSRGSDTQLNEDEAPMQGSSQKASLVAYLTIEASGIEKIIFFALAISL